MNHITKMGFSIRAKNLASINIGIKYLPRLKRSDFKLFLNANLLV